MSPHSEEVIRALSVVVFGQRHRLELMTAVARSEDGIVCLKDLAEEQRVSSSSLQKPLKDLLSAGLLSALPSGDSKRRYYQRTPSAAWEFAVELVERFSEAEDGQPDHSRPK